MTTKAEITKLAKAIHASHLAAAEGSTVMPRTPRAIPWPYVEAYWRSAMESDRQAYMLEATQVLRTITRAPQQQRRPTDDRRRPAKRARATSRA